jgi:hypothetical protein
MYTVYAAFKDADMTEGKGPMILDQVFGYRQDAYSYIQKQLGVMGRRADPSLGWAKMGDWEVRELIVLASLEEVQMIRKEELIASAMNKLNPDEIAELRKHFAK